MLNFVSSLVTNGLKKLRYYILFARNLMKMLYMRLLDIVELNKFSQLAGILTIHLH